VVPHSYTTALVRVCNTGGQDVMMRQGSQVATAINTTVVTGDQFQRDGVTLETNRCDGTMASHRCASVTSNSSTNGSSTRATKIQEIVQQLYEQLPDSLSSDTKQEVITLLERYESILSVDDYDLEFTNILSHKIDTGGNRPVREALRRHPQPYMQYIDDEVDKMLAANVIEPAQSDWASNVCLAKRKDGRLRFAIDYRRVNRLTKPDTYPLPRIDNCLDMLNGACWFSTLDLRSGFWQVAQDPVDADKTTFITRKGSFRFKVLAFGLQGSPSLFQRVMDLVLAGLTWDKCLVYIDDIIVYARTPEMMLERLEQVFERLQKHHLKVKPSKLRLFQQKLTFLGYQISAAGIETDPAKTSTILDMARPTNVKELRSNMGCLGYYRRFISSFSQIAEPLFALLRKGEKFVWTDKQQRAFDILKAKLASTPILALPCDEAQTILDVDASDTGLGPCSAR